MAVLAWTVHDNFLLPLLSSLNATIRTTGVLIFLKWYGNIYSDCFGAIILIKIDFFNKKKYL